MKITAPPPFTLRITGTRTASHTLTQTSTLDPTAEEYFSVDQAYRLDAVARSVGEVYEADSADQQLVRLETEDQTEWIGLPDDLPDVFGKPAEQRSGQQNAEVFTIPVSLQPVAPGTHRGVFQAARVKLVELISRRNSPASTSAEKLAIRLAERVDRAACPIPGLFRISGEGELDSAALQRLPAVSNRILIFIHGTASSFIGGFSGIQPAAWDELHALYPGGLYAFNHYTITKSPVRNALDLFPVLPKGVKCDIITHSRGGLVGDVLTRCDAKRGAEIGYSSEEINGFQSEILETLHHTEGAKVGAQLTQELRDVTALARGKQLHVRRLVRVACPSAGTTQLSERLDHLLNAVLNLLKLTTGGIMLPVVGVLRAFLMAVIDERHDPDSFPGLFAMVPESPYSVLNNNPQISLPSELVAIAGDSEFGGKLLQSLKVILSNLYYWRANDLVVDTASMSRGILQRAHNFRVLIEDKAVDHFSYFNDPERFGIVLAVLKSERLPGAVLPQGFDLQNTTDQSVTRGAVINRLYDTGAVSSTKITGAKPIVVLLPGIMGSNLAQNDSPKWMRLSALMAGALVDDLHIAANDITAESAMDDFYGNMVRHLAAQGYDVEVFPYDWRLSLKQAGRQLNKRLTSLLEHKQPIKILAHSMGGLLVRQLMLDAADEQNQDAIWPKFRGFSSSRVVLLGTPWRGSHLITEVLSGHSSRVRQLYLLDLKHTKKHILKTVGAFPGVLELLPLDEPALRNDEEWQRLLNASGRGVPPLHPDALVQFKKYHSALATALPADEFARITYVAGHHAKTVDGYTFKYRRFFKRETLRYTTTPFGDGSVTWARGIPSQLPVQQVFYTEVEHGMLCAEPALFEGIVELLEQGTTNKFADAPIASLANSTSRSTRSAFAKTAPYPTAPITQLSPQAALFGIVGGKKNTTKDEVGIRVEIFNGDLLFADYPVVVGHFERTGIVGAERAVDTYLKGALSERHRMGFYPGDIGTQEVLFDPNSRPRGAIVVGLGNQDHLTTSTLTQTVEKGLLKYALFQRDNQLADPTHPGGGHGVSMLLVGSNYGQLSLRECVRSLVSAALHVNEAIRALNDHRHAADGQAPLLRFTVVELVDYFEDRALEAFQQLTEMVALKDLKHVILPEAITPGFGKRRRLLREGSRSWWQILTTCAKSSSDDGVIDRLEFTAANRGSSVSADTAYGDLGLPRALADNMAQSGTYSPTDAKVLFELLIPNRYKDFLRSHRNVLWRLDRESAALPWELFHDTDTGDEPTFVRAGMVRQLESRTAELRPSLVREPTALIIGDPVLGSDLDIFQQLQGARQEAKAVNAQLSSNVFETEAQISSSAVEIIRALFRSDYKVLHIAAHGTFEEGQDSEQHAGKVAGITNRTGIVLGNGQRLTPGRIRQLSAIPELVFINCCYGGVIDEQQEKYRRTRYRLAANVGTQLIEIGVQAVIVAGWEVEDNAAAAFAKTFYDDLLAGRTFGEAVRRARQTAYQNFPHTNTWGAYQAYGDPFYRLVVRDVYEEAATLKIHLAEELILELNNLVSRVRSIPYSHVGDLDKVRHQAAELEILAEERDLINAGVLESLGMLHLYLGSYARAIAVFERLVADDGASFALSTYFRLLHTNVKHLATQALQPLDEEIKPSEITLKAYQDISQLIKELEEYPAVNKGVRIHSQLGSMYKRAAALSPDDQSSRSFLKHTADAYLSAAKQLGIFSPKAIYHVSAYISFVALQVASEQDSDLEQVERRAAKSINDVLGVTPTEYFAKWKDERRYYAQDRNSSYSSLREANLSAAELLWNLLSRAVPDEETDEWIDQLIGIHRQQRLEGFNLRDVQGQAEHYLVLLALCKRFDLLEENELRGLRRLYAWVRVHPNKRAPGGGATANFDTDDDVSTAGPTPPDPPDTPGSGGTSTPPSGDASHHDDAVKAEGLDVSHHSSASSLLEEAEDSNLLLAAYAIDIDTPAETRARKGKRKLRIKMPKGAAAALLKLTVEDGDDVYAWLPADGAQATRGVKREDDYLTLDFSATNNRGLIKGIGKLFKRVRRAVVQFYGSTKGFVEKELRNNYSFQVVRVGKDGRIIYDLIKSRERGFAEATENTERSLLMLHGMFNTAAGTFKDLLGKAGEQPNSAFAKLLVEQYNGRALVMNMPTIFRSFEHNVDHFPLASVLSTQLDVMANSRGTNVARELVTRLDAKQFPARGRVFLAGGPAFGTPLADADHMLSLVNAITTMVRLAGKPLGPIIPVLTFLVERASKKILSGEGLIDMAPGSSSLERLNAKWDFKDPATLYVGSNYEPRKKDGNPFKRLMDAQLIDRAIMAKAHNDGVIPTKGTLGLARGASYPKANTATRYRVDDTEACGHFDYYKYEEVVDLLVKFMRVT